MFPKLQSLTDFIVKVSRFGFKVLSDFYHESGLTRSASLAYTTLLAIGPVSIVVISVVSFFPFFDHLIANIEAFIFANFVPHTGEVILNVIEEFQEQAHALPWISFIFMGVTAYLMLSTMENHVNALWGITRRRFLGLSFLIHWGTLIIGPLFLCASLGVSSFLSSIHWLQIYNFSPLLIFLPFLCSFLAYAFLYFTLPNCKVKIRHVCIGAFFAALLFEGAKVGFAFYVPLVPTYTILYGALAVIPLFLIWLYLSSVIFLLGAQIVNALRIR